MAQEAWLRVLASTPLGPLSHTENKGRKPHQPLNYLKIKSGSGTKSPEENTDSEVKGGVRFSPLPNIHGKGKGQHPFPQGTRVSGAGRRYRTKKPIVLNKSQAGNFLEAACSAHV